MLLLSISKNNLFSSHVYLLFQHGLPASRGGENVIYRVFIALYHILWEQTEAITQPRSDLVGVGNELLELE